MASWSTQLLILPKSIKRARGDLLGKLYPPCGSTAIHLRFYFVSVLKYSIFYKNLVSSFYLSIFFVKDALVSDNYLFFSGILRNVRFSENLTCFVFLKHPFWDWLLCLITGEVRIWRNLIFWNMTVINARLMCLEISVSYIGNISLKFFMRTKKHRDWWSKVFSTFCYYLLLINQVNLFFKKMTWHFNNG